MATKRSTSKPAEQEPDVITVELTPEQQALIQRQSKGKVKISTLKLRPDLNLRLQELTIALGVGMKIKQKVAMGPTYWA
jgi:hypothetical protein